MKTLVSAIAALFARRAAAQADARARWSAIKSAALTQAERAAVQHAESFAHEAVLDTFGPHALMYPSEAVLNAFARTAIEQLPNAARKTPAIESIGRLATI